MPHPLSPHAIRTTEEVARIMTERGYPMKRSTVVTIEQNALRKLSRLSLVKALAIELDIITEEAKP